MSARQYKNKDLIKYKVFQEGIFLFIFNLTFFFVLFKMVQFKNIF